ncbi:MAG: helix-turn-helix transcriptional regulator [Bacteroidaceae bacterium]|nr:helix-turn-helix transcriptional regulator [Bacteroidaceae bacterium]MBR6805489.1 helix-turn-helix transcriptional regulator [Bacteroidaceae bacterium]
MQKKEQIMKNRIRVARAEVRMTQQQLADATGVSRQTINAIESGKFVPSTLLALKIAATFGLRVEDIFSLEDGD